jgi:hypothetical protein
MIKKTIGIFIILIASGVWFYLDLLNKQVLGGAEQIHASVENARAEAKKRAAAREEFENMVLVYMNECQVAAQEARDNYLNLIDKALKIEVENPEMPIEVKVNVEQLMVSAKAECQRTYEKNLKTGF